MLYKQNIIFLLDSMSRILRTIVHTYKFYTYVYNVFCTYLLFPTRYQKTRLFNREKRFKEPLSSTFRQYFLWHVWTCFRQLTKLNLGIITALRPKLNLGLITKFNLEINTKFNLGLITKFNLGLISKLNLEIRKILKSNVLLVNLLKLDKISFWQTW